MFSGPHGSTVDQPLHTAYTFKVSFEFYLFGSVRLRRLCVTFQGRTKSYLSICDDTSDSPHRPDANAALVPPEHHARWPLRELPPLVVSTWCVPLPKLEVCTPLSFIFAFVKRFVSFARFSPTCVVLFPPLPDTLVPMPPPTCARPGLISSSPPAYAPALTPISATERKVRVFARDSVHARPVFFVRARVPLKGDPSDLRQPLNPKL